MELEFPRGAYASRHPFALDGPPCPTVVPASPIVMSRYLKVRQIGKWWLKCFILVEKGASLEG